MLGLAMTFLRNVGACIPDFTLAGPLAAVGSPAKGFTLVEESLGVICLIYLMGIHKVLQVNRKKGYMWGWSEPVCCLPIFSFLCDEKFMSTPILPCSSWRK